MLLTEFYDDEYENNGFISSRVTARALLFNDRGEMALIHIKGQDSFGVRDHFETPGGGVEKNENYQEALVREIQEEVGVNATINDYLGLVINRYNLINVITAHHFFVASVAEKSVKNLTEHEAELFAEVVWMKPEKWVEVLKKPVSDVNKLVHQRELFIVEYYLNKSKTKG